MKAFDVIKQQSEESKSSIKYQSKKTEFHFLQTKNQFEVPINQKFQINGIKHQFRKPKVHLINCKQPPIHIIDSKAKFALSFDTETDSFQNVSNVPRPNQQQSGGLFNIFGGNSNNAFSMHRNSPQMSNFSPANPMMMNPGSLFVAGNPMMTPSNPMMAQMNPPMNPFDPFMIPINPQSILMHKQALQVQNLGQSNPMRHQSRINNNQVAEQILKGHSLLQSQVQKVQLDDMHEKLTPIIQSNQQNSSVRQQQESFGSRIINFFKSIGKRNTQEHQPPKFNEPIKNDQLINNQDPNVQIKKTFSQEQLESVEKKQKNPNIIESEVSNYRQPPNPTFSISGNKIEESLVEEYVEKKLF